MVGVQNVTLYIKWTVPEELPCKYTGITVMHQLEIQLLPLYISLNLPVSTPWIPFPPLNLPISTAWIKLFQLLFRYTVHIVVTKCSYIIPVTRVLSEVKESVLLHICTYTYHSEGCYMCVVTEILQLQILCTNVYLHCGYILRTHTYTYVLSLV